jgi:hypothetical protein
MNRGDRREVTAERIIAAELKRRKWRKEDLAARAKGDLGKVAIAARVRTLCFSGSAVGLGGVGGKIGVATGGGIEAN